MKMASEAKRTLVCSVLFIDIAAYSTRGVDEQVRLKQKLNELMSEALRQFPEHERIVVDTGDGAGVGFLENPEAALFSALAMLDHAAEVQVRMGLNLGPVTLVDDINGRENMVGDGINVAERIMSFARPGQLLVSRSFYEVVSQLSREYAELFQVQPKRTDKHNRAHELYAVSDAVRVGRRVAHSYARLRKERRAPTPHRPESAQVYDAGAHYVVSGHSEAAVRAKIEELERRGHRLLSAVVQVGSKWLASVANPKLTVRATVEAYGFKRLVSAPTREAVEAAVEDLVAGGAVLLQSPELVDGLWRALCEKT